jgi:hypothetical protein
VTGPVAPQYTAAHPQIGFEVVQKGNIDRVRPIIRGGDLDVYDGRPLEELSREAERQK